MRDEDDINTAVSPVTGRRGSASLGVLVFGFGVAAGFLIAFSGLGVLADSAGLIVSVFLVTVFLVTIGGIVLYFLRRPILRFLFGIAETQIETFAEPLAEVARATAARDPERATENARALLQLALARYSWIASRRWVIASLTGLIAAMAALAGAALLFNQNELIRTQAELMQDQNTLILTQSELMTDQNARIAEQTELLAKDVQLAEAARNAQIAVEVTRIAELLGQTLTRSGDGQPIGPDSAPLLAPASDLDLGLIMRIAAASQAARPYRFLDLSRGGWDDLAKMQVAMERRRGELPQSYGQMARLFGWRDLPADTPLIDRPASPERGQLLNALLLAGVHEFELLSFYGLDLSYAHARGARLLAQSMQMVQLSYADLSGAQMIEVDFSGASLENARFRRARIERSVFATLESDSARGPYRTTGGEYAMFTAGVDFSESLLRDVIFEGARGVAMNFDGATLVNSRFTDSWISAATFRGAVLIGVDFSGAGMKSVDFDGAYVFDPDFLTGLAAQAYPESFRPGRFAIEAVPLDEVLEVFSTYQEYDAESLAAAAGMDRAWRITRTGEFEK